MLSQCLSVTLANTVQQSCYPKVLASCAPHTPWKRPLSHVAHILKYCLHQKQCFRQMFWQMFQAAAQEIDLMGCIHTGDLQGAAFADLSGKDFSGKKYYKSDFKGVHACWLKGYGLNKHRTVLVEDEQSQLDCHQTSTGILLVKAEQLQF